MTTVRQPGRDTGAGWSVLVVDDNTDAADTLALLLRLHGHRVTTAYTGADALAAARNEEPDAVFLDLRLPGADGYEVARHLRAAVPGRKLLLVAVTGYGQDGDHKRTREAGFDHHLVKPADPAALLALLGPGPPPDRNGHRPA